MRDYRYELFSIDDGEPVYVDDDRSKVMEMRDDMNATAVRCGGPRSPFEVWDTVEELVLDRPAILDLVKDQTHQESTP